MRCTHARARTHHAVMLWLHFPRTHALVLGSFSVARMYMFSYDILAHGYYYYSPYSVELTCDVIVFSVLFVFPSECQCFSVCLHVGLSYVLCCVHYSCTWSFRRQVAPGRFVDKLHLVVSSTSCIWSFRRQVALGRFVDKLHLSLIVIKQFNLYFPPVPFRFNFM